MPTTSNFGWNTPADTDLVKDGALAIRTLGNNIDTSLVDLKGGTTGQILSKNSNTDLDYTWINNDQGDITEVQAGTGISVASGTGPVPVITNTVATEFDAKGDLVVGTGADTFDKLTAGNNNDVLTVDSSTATGLKWAAPAASSPLTTKGDLYTYDTGNARLGVGANGETLVADSTTTTGLRWNPLPVQTNPVLNGAFDIWQRGTSFTSNTAVYTADRWYQGANQNQGTVSRQDTNDTTNLPEIQYCLRYGRSNGATDTDDLAIQQSFENVNSTPFIGKTVTFSFYARKGANFSQSASTLTARLKSGTGTDQNLYSGFTGETNAVSISAVLTTTWQRFTGTATIATSAKQLGVQFFYAPVGTAGAADYFEITGVQVDAGSVALPFRRSGGTIQGELAACERYYYDSRTATWTTTSTGIATANNRIATNAVYPVSMRAKPTITLYSFNDTASRVSVFDATADVGTGVVVRSETISKNAFSQLSDSGTPFTAATNYWYGFVASAEL